MKRKNKQHEPGNTKEISSSPGLPKMLWIGILLIVAMGFLAYGNSLNNKFIWDDGALIAENSHITNWSNIGKLFSSDIGSGGGTHFVFYRPLQMVTYMMDYALFGRDVRIYHFTNILLHVLTALAVYWLICTLFNDHVVGFLTGALFVVHPIHTEAVAYMSGRADPLAAVFLILSLIFYANSTRKKRVIFYFFMLLSYCLALLSKELSLILPALLLLYGLTFKEKIANKESASVLIITLVYIVLRMTALHFPGSQPIVTTTLLKRLPGFFVAIAEYIRLLFLPLNLHMEYGVRYFRLSDPMALAGLAVLSAALLYLFRGRRKGGIAFFAIGWFLITLLPQSNLYQINAYMAEHWLYLPSIGFFLLLARGISLLWTKRSSKIVASVIFITAIILWSILTMVQNKYWKEPVSFYLRTLKYSPGSGRTYSNLGIEYSGAGKVKEAIAMYEKAINLKQASREAYYNLGTLYTNVGNYAKAIEAFENVIRLDPSYFKAYCNIGIAYSDLNNQPKAIEMLRKAIELNPDFAQAYNNLGNSYSAIGNKEEAVRSYKRAIEINPYYAEAYNNLGTEQSDKGEAVKFYKRAIEIKPDYAEAYYNLSTTLRETGRDSEAMEYYKKAKELNPNL